MAEEKVAIRIAPTPGNQEISDTSVQRLARVVKLPADQLKQRIAAGQALKFVMIQHPRVAQLVELIKSLGFSVTVSSVQADAAAPPAPKRLEAPPKTKKPSSEKPKHVAEWDVGDIIENLYEVKEIRYGGMGAVYVVRHLGWNAMLAVKSLYHELRKNEDDRALFVKEAETWIDIGFHPNIAACYYVRNIQDSPRIFIEYVDGGSLNQWAANRPSAGWDVIIDLMVQVGDGLEHAHSKGLIHRDIKPANCMLTRDGMVKVTDFGLTKRRMQDKAGQSGIGITALGTLTIDAIEVTAAGMGTPAFMAPEMWVIGEEVGPEVDIYAFGVMFFEMCCGRKPFMTRKGERPAKLAYAHLHEPPPRPSSIREDMPLQLEEVILKCLEKKPSDRYSSFGQIRQALAGAYEEIFKVPFPREQPDEVRLLADALNNRAVSLMDLSHQDEAHQALEKALELDPHHPEAVYNRGLLDWMRTGDPDRELAVKMEEVVKTPEYRGRGGHLLGRILLTLGDAPAALKAWELSLSTEGASEAWLRPYSLALVGVGNEKDAVTHLQSYLTEYPNDHEANGWLIGALVRMGKLEDARARLKSLTAGSRIASMTLDDIARTFCIAGSSEKLVLQGHSGWITCVSYFPTSQKLITGSRDRVLKIWDARTGQELKTMTVLGGPPASVWVSPSEQFAAIAAAKAGEPVKILDLESGRLVGNLAAPDRLTTLGFSPDGASIVSVEEKGTVRMWTAADLRAAGVYKIPTHTAAAMIFDSQSRPMIFIAGLDRVVKRVDPLNAQVQPLARGHSDQITALKVTPDGGTVLTGGRDKQAIAWDGWKGERLTVFSAHKDQVGEVAVSPTGRMAASYEPRAGIKVWETQSGLVLRTFSASDALINCLAFTPDDEALMAGGKDMTLRIWDVRGRPVLPNLALARIRPVKKQMISDRDFKEMLSIAGTAMKKRAFATAYSMIRKAQALPGYERSDVALEMILRMKEYGRRVGLRRGWQRKTVPAGSGVMAVCFSPSAINFLTAQADHTLRMWSTKTGDCLKIMRGHSNVVASLALSPNGREAVTGGDDRSVRVWDLNLGKETLVLQGHGDSVSSVDFAADGKTVLSGSWDGTVRQWRVPEGSTAKVFRGHEDKVSTVRFLGNGGLILSAGFEGTVKMWDAASGRGLRDMKGHKERITCLAVSPGGEFFLSGSMDGTVRVWDAKRGTATKALDVDRSGVRSVAFCPVPRFALTASNDATVRLWDLETATCLRDFQGHSREVTGTDFASTGQFAISSSLDGSVMIWELDWEWNFSAQKPSAGTPE